jgi:hypothetical protein
MPRSNRISDIRYKINDFVIKSNQIKYFSPSREFFSPISSLLRQPPPESTPNTLKKEQIAAKAFKLKKQITKGSYRPLNNDLMFDIPDEFKTSKGYNDSDGAEDKPSKTHSDSRF